ncbi:hypothetical protein WSK_1614 [Novosphingobium sp. Rr 2-17]|uniref:O-antigen ligase family protein n=1 Tax=Novosphingobium sp. Rr 2-17 TaxID=555793 RepID=UPI0002699B90|nr:O-antigen ligase family protein [Novosphingobium sp. Rr 2-17]EIZ79789.1 hypothetical protein WSK_1614 [Novosphingobium sp. Rr 2-17]
MHFGFRSMLSSQNLTDVGGRSQNFKHRRPPVIGVFSKFINFLIFTYIIIWALDPALFGGAAVIFPAARWLLAVAMILLLPLATPKGIGKAWPAIFFVIVLGATLLLDQERSEAFPIYLRIVSTVTVAILVGSMTLDKRVRAARSALFASAAIVLSSELFGVVAPSLAYKLIGLDRPRLYGVTTHPGILGYLAAFVSVFYISKSILGRGSYSRKERRRSFFVGITVGVALLMADSRTGQIAVAVGLGVAIFLIFVLRVPWVLRNLAPAWLALATISLLAVSFPVWIASGAYELSNVSKGDRYSGSTLGRIEIWQGGIREFERNKSTGAGLASTFRTSDMSEAQEPLFYYHSVLINYLAKAGILGGAAVILIYLGISWSVMSAARQFSYFRLNMQSSPSDANKDDHEIAQNLLTLLLYANAGWAVTLVYSVTEAALQNMYPSFLIFFTALTLTTRKNQQL